MSLLAEYDMLAAVDDDAAAAAAHNNHMSLNQKELPDFMMLDSAVRGLEKKEIVAGKAHFATQENEKKEKSFKGKDESVDEYFRRMSHIREMIYKCRSEKKKFVAGLTAGSLEYSKAIERFKNWAVPYTTAEFNNKANFPRFPAALKEGIPWFNGLKSQFIEVLQRHHNIDLFANQVVIQNDIFQMLFNFRRYSQHVPLVDLVAKSGLRWDEGMRPAIVLAGDRSCAKSYMFKATSKQFPPGIFDDVTHRTAMTAMTSGMNDLRITAIDEATSAMLGGGTGASAKEFAGSAANSVNKSLQTNKRGHTQTIDTSDGDRKTVDFYSSNIGTTLYATNVRLPPSSDPAMARLIIVMVDCIDATNEDAIEKLLLKLQEPELDELKNDALEGRQLINFYLLLYELYIAMGVIQDVQMDAWVMYFQRYCENMQTCSFVLQDPKKFVQITELARTMTIVYAVQIGLFSEITYDQRVVDPLNPDTAYVRYWDKARYFVDIVERHLVCTRSVSVYVVSLCRDMWANPLKLTILASANKATVAKWKEIFDVDCFDEDPTKRRKPAPRVNDDGVLASSLSSSGIMDDDASREATFEEEQELYDDYGCEGDRDNSNIWPDEEGNYINETSRSMLEQKRLIPVGPAEADRLQGIITTSSSSSVRDGGVDGERRKKARSSEIAEAEDKIVQGKPIGEEDSQPGAPAAPAVAPAGAAGTSLYSTVMSSAEAAAAAAAQSTTPLVSPNEEALKIFMWEFNDGEQGKPTTNPNYVEVRGVHMTVQGSCELLLQQVKDGNRPSVSNLATELANMEDQDITVPFYEFRGRFVHRTDRFHTIKLVRIEKNTLRYDPHSTYGSNAERVYVALHAVLNNHSLNKGVIRSIRNLGFDHTIAGRCIVNIPVEANRYAGERVDNPVMTMYGINRIVRIVPRNVPFVFVKTSTVTRSMLDIIVSMRRGNAAITVSPSLMNCAHALVVTCEPEIEAAVAHAALCGVPPDTPLYGTPVHLERMATRIARTTPNLNSMKLYSYPRRKMEEYRERYLVQDEHANTQFARRFHGWVPSTTDSKRSAQSGKRPTPCTEALRAVAHSGLRALVNMITPTSLVNRPDVTFNEVLSTFKNPAALRAALEKIHVDEQKFIDVLLRRQETDVGVKSRQKNVAKFEIGNRYKMQRDIDDAEVAKAAADVPKCPAPAVTLQMHDEFEYLERRMESSEQLHPYGTVSSAPASATSSDGTPHRLIPKRNARNGAGAVGQSSVSPPPPPPPPPSSPSVIAGSTIHLRKAWTGAFVEIKQ